MAEEAQTTKENLEAAPRLAEALQQFAAWNDAGLPVVVWSSEEMANAFYGHGRPASEQLPAKTLVLDLGNLAARLYPGHFIKEGFTPHGIAKLAGAARPDLEAMAALTKMLLGGLSERYYIPVTYFGQLMDLYRPEALEAMRESQRTAADAETAASPAGQAAPDSGAAPSGDPTPD